MRTITFSVAVLTLAAVAVTSGCIRKDEKPEDNKAAAPAAAPPAPPPEPARAALALDQNTTYTLVSVPTNKCVQFAGRDANEQALAEIAACDKSPAQQFKLQPVPGNYWALVNVLSGKCLDVQAIVMDDGGLIQQFTCNGGPNQQWIVADATPGTIRLVARHSGKVLDVKDAATADGSKIIQSTWRSTPNEQFKLLAVGAEPPAAAAKGAPRAEGGGKAKKDKAKKPAPTP